MKRNEESIAIYSRKSKFTGKGESIGNQIELCRDYVRSLFGAENVERCVVFEDEGFSGGNLKRPAFQRMMEEVRRHKFKAIIVYRLDRISRNINDFTGLIDELTKLDVSFVSIREQFDTSTPMGRAMMFIISVFSQLERETIAERIRDNMHELAKTGRWLGGNTPTGYASESVSNVTVDGKVRKACKLKLIPQEAAIVRTIFDLYAEMDSLTAVEAELLRRGLKTKKGNDFTRFSIKGILQNPVYMIADEEARQYLEDNGVFLYTDLAAFDGGHGLMVYNRTDQEKGKASTYLPMTEWIVSVGRHPGLIPANQWIAVQRSLTRNKSKSYRKPRNNEALLTGLIYCACGERMYPKLSNRTAADGNAIYTYVCKMKARSKGVRCSARNANGNGLDRAVLEQVESLPEDGGYFSARLKKSRRMFTDLCERPDSQLTRLRMEHAENEKKIEGLIDTMSLLDEPAAKVRIAGYIEKLSADNRNMECRIRELESQRPIGTLTEEEFEGLRHSLEIFGENVEAMSLEEKRELLRSVVQTVTWDGGTAHVRLFGTEEAGISNGAKTPWCEDSK